jgi:putative hydrolase of the HAD superfamily
VALYRTHVPTIALASDAAAWLSRHRHSTRLALITDGLAITQTNKIRALGLDRGGIAPLVCTDEWGRQWWKPHPRSFEFVARHFGEPGARCVYVADNPAKDFIAPRALGWRTVQICRDGALHARRTGGRGAVYADTVIATLDELDHWLEVLCSQAAGSAHAGR